MSQRHALAADVRAGPGDELHPLLPTPLPAEGTVGLVPHHFEILVAAPAEQHRPTYRLELPAPTASWAAGDEAVMMSSIRPYSFAWFGVMKKSRSVSCSTRSRG